MIDLASILRSMGGIGGQAPGQPPGATPPFVPAQQPTAPPPGAPGAGGFMDRLQGQLFGAADTPEAQATRNRAMLQLGLGMMAAGSKGQGLGEGMFNSYAMASKDFEGAMDKAFQTTERKRLEEKDDTRRNEDMDWKKTVFGSETADRRVREEREAKAEQERLRLQERGQDIQGRLGNIRGSDDAARGRKAEMEADLMERRIKRLDYLESKRASGQLSPDEQAELRALNSGARVGFEPTNPFSMFGDMMNGGTGNPGGNPLVGDPRMRF